MSTTNSLDVQVLLEDYLDRRQPDGGDGYLQRVLDGAEAYARRYISTGFPLEIPADLADAIYTLAAHRALAKDLNFGGLAQVGNGEDYAITLNRLPASIHATFALYKRTPWTDIT